MSGEKSHLPPTHLPQTYFSNLEVYFINISYILALREEINMQLAHLILVRLFKNNQFIN